MKEEYNEAKTPQTRRERTVAVPTDKTGRQKGKSLSVKTVNCAQKVEPQDSSRGPGSQNPLGIDWTRSLHWFPISVFPLKKKKVRAGRK